MADDKPDLPTIIDQTQSPDLRRAAIKAIPYLGPALDELAYGRLNEARFNRLERTLTELGEMMEERDLHAEEVLKEEFAALLEVVAPEAARTTSEEKRERLRDLLLNAVPLASGDDRWTSARMAAELLSGLNDAELTLLAAIGRVSGRPDLTFQVDGPSVVGSDEHLAYNWLVVDQAYRQLSSKPNQLLIGGARAEMAIEKTGLTPLGSFLLDWAVADEPG